MNDKINASAKVTLLEGDLGEIVSLGAEISLNIGLREKQEYTIDKL